MRNNNRKDAWEDDNWPLSEEQQWQEYQDMIHKAASGRELTDEDNIWGVYSDEALEEEIENFYREIVEYAEELKLPVSYVEEEFVILGELVKHKD